MADWGDEDDAFLGELDVDAQVAQALHRRQSGSHATNSGRAPAPVPAFAAAAQAANPQQYTGEGGLLAQGWRPTISVRSLFNAPPGHPPPAQVQQQSSWPAPAAAYQPYQQPGSAAQPPITYPGGGWQAPQPPYYQPQQQQQQHQHIAAAQMSHQRQMPYAMQQMPQQLPAQHQYHQQQQPLPQHQYQQQQQQQQERPVTAAAPAAAPPAPAAPAAAATTICKLYASLELARAPPSGAAQGEQRLTVRMGWHDAAAAALRRLAGGAWDGKHRVWTFPLAAHDRVIEALQGVTAVKVVVQPLHPLPAAVLKAAAAIPDDSSRYCHIPTALESQLMPFQREGVKFALARGGRCLIGDEMGLGKTVQAIAVAAAYRDEWPGLVVAPSSLREQWADALHRWLGVTEDRLHVVHSGKDAAAVPTKGLDFLIVSYNFLDKMDLGGGRYKVVIVDESHYIKDGTAKRTKAAQPVLREARRCLLLTGTPALNRPKEIFTQLSALVPPAKIRMKDFGERYCAGNRFDKYGGAQNLEELHAMLHGSVMVRRLKAQVLTQLPKKRRQQVFLSLDAPARKELAGLQRQMEAVKQMAAQLVAANAASNGGVSLGGGGARMEENRAVMEAYRRTAELKSGAVQEYVEMLLDGGQKFLVFAHHKALLDAVEHSCNRRKGCRFIRIDGATPPRDRGRLVSSFQEDDSIKVAVLSIKAAGVGLTLTAASTVVFAEMTWTPGEIIQAEDRAHRIGQASAVNIHFLHVRGSVDDVIWAAIQSKLESVGQALDGQDRGMEVTAARTMPTKGQQALDKYVTQPQQAQQAQVGAEEFGGGAGPAPLQLAPPPLQRPRGGSPGKATQQASLRHYFGAGAQQAEAAGGAAGPPGGDGSGDDAGQENDNAGALVGTKRKLG